MQTKERYSVSFTSKAIDAGRKIERVIVNHSNFVAARDQLLRLADRAHKLKDPGGLLLVGDSGTGKDCLIEEMKVFFPSSNLMDVTRRPLLVAHTEATPSIGDYLGKLLTQVGYEFAKFGKADNSARREVLVEAMIACRVQLLLINEFQHVIEGDRKKLGHSFADWFKRLYDDTRVPMAFLGTPEALKIEGVNEQFTSRFTGRHYLRPLGITPEFFGVLKAFDSAVPDLTPAGLGTSAFAYRIHAATGGVMRPLKRLIKEAVMVAVARADAKLTLEHFRIAFHCLHGEKGENPFVEK